MEQPIRGSDKNSDAARQAAQNQATQTTVGRNDGDGGMTGGTVERARQVGEQAISAVGDVGEQAKSAASDTIERARQIGEQAGPAASSAVATAQELARRAREQTSAATDIISEQSARASQYLTRNVNDYPLTSLLVAGAIGYGIAYLVHGGSLWQTHGSDRHEHRNHGGGQVKPGQD
jgi:ElaB/YqjD/DUF883 family membrane-anchored ribosome-binding protein